MHLFTTTSLDIGTLGCPFLCWALRPIKRKRGSGDVYHQQGFIGLHFPLLDILCHVREKKVLRGAVP